jgi:hypothetical protein
MTPDLRFSLVHRDGTCEVAGLILDGLNASGSIDGKQVRLDSVSGKFADGVFTGQITVDDWSVREIEQRHLRLQLFDASYGKAMSQLLNLMESPESTQDALARDAGKGRMDADLDLVLTRSAPRSFGRGRITLRNAPIGQIHLFGGLSKALKSMGLGFSTLDLDTAAIEWQLADQKVAIPNSLITGPVLSIDLTGKLDLRSKTVNLEADAYFFQGFISKVLTPVTDNLLFDVTGPIDDPVWTLRLNPFRWFQNRFPQSTPVP